tara:strand:- start:33 stop:545 length:513 start_codon:yes stop_codon:yes gene_type:complete
MPQTKEEKKAKRKEWYLKNKERERAKQKKYYEADRDRRIEKVKKYREDNREELLEKGRKYYHDNKEELSLKAKKYRENNKEARNKASREYSYSPIGQRKSTIKNWKRYGILSDNYDKLYDNYLKSSNCEECGVVYGKIGDGSNTWKCCDHDHETGLFRNFLCNKCNIKRG